MSDIHQKISTLLRLLETDTNEENVLEKGGMLLNHLRNMWRSNRHDYSPEDITRLQEATRQLGAVESFLEEEAEFEYISDSDDANDVIARLYPLVEALDGLAIAGRVEKEIRELLDRARKMPTRAANVRSAALSKGIQSLSAKAPTCKKCGSKMTLREGNGSFFWGCSTFPKCWSSRQLNKTESRALNN